jgi:imidazole glycerol-phosphate synthase subunit HisH
VRVAIVDYGMGNRRSVEKAFEHVGVEPLLTSDRSVLENASRIVLPGVGAFPRAMRALGDLGLVEVLRARAAAGAKLLGICLGMQLLFERSEELGGADGLGLLEGDVVALRAPKVPHIGWNRLEPVHASALLPERESFYHVHSFACRPSDEAVVVGRGEYSDPFVSIVERGNVAGVQFHPEKSSRAGLSLLGRWAAA